MPPMSTPPLKSVLLSLRTALTRFALVGVSPIVAFYVAFRLWGPVNGMVAGTVTATVALLIQASRTRRFDPIGIVPIAAVLIQGGVGIAFQSVDLYLAAPALEMALWGAVLLGSVALGRPIVMLAASELNLLPATARRTPAMVRAFSTVTLVWGVVSFVKAATRLSLLAALPLEVFLVTNTVVITGINVLLLSFSVWYPLRVTRKNPALVEPATSPAPLRS